MVNLTVSTLLILRLRFNPQVEPSNRGRKISNCLLTKLWKISEQTANHTFSAPFIKPFCSTMSESSRYEQNNIPAWKFWEKASFKSKNHIEKCCSEICKAVNAADWKKHQRESSIAVASQIVLYLSRQQLYRFREWQHVVIVRVYARDDNVSH